ncbi:MAG TPA: FISUMP domain-containing protein [Patescibacteria group bacterium]|nr:FISUMP domain-containing protein [Patescibacteria group bacterium]
MKRMESRRILLGGMLLVIFFLGCKMSGEANNDTGTIVYGSPLIDREGNSYRTVIIDGKTWMADNFKSTRDADGQVLPGVYAHGDSAANAATYGRLYDWTAANAAAPAGWRLPTAAEWEALIARFGGRSAAGGPLKEAGTSRWLSPNTGATNSSGFTAVGGGFRGSDGIFYALGEHGSYWGTADQAASPYCTYLYNTTTQVSGGSNPEDRDSRIAFAVRYVKE